METIELFQMFFTAICFFYRTLNCAVVLLVFVFYLSAATAIHCFVLPANDKQVI